MTAIATVPSLSEDSWTTDSVKVADYILSYFLTSQYSQTYLYIGHITSFAYIIQSKSGDVNATVIETQNQLTAYFSKYFVDVNVEVANVPNTVDPSMAQISIVLQYSDLEGIQYNLAKLLQITNLKVVKIIDYNNTGVLS